jgi:hypothetical protein
LIFFFFFFSLFPFVENTHNKTAFFIFMIIFFSMLFIRLGEETKKARELLLLLAVRVNGMQSRFSPLSLFYFVNGKEARCRRGRWWCCVYL